MVKTENTYIRELLGAFLIHRAAYRFDTEKRNFSVLSFRLEGETVFDCMGKSITVKRGETVYIPPNIEYSQEASMAEEIIAVHFNTDRPLFDGIKVFSLPDYDLFSEVLGFYLKGDIFESLSALYKILARLDVRREDGSIGFAEDYLRTRFADSDTTVSRLADISGFSETHFRNLFKERHGVAPYKYLRGLRIERAKALLMSGYYSVKETARLCGYDNEKNFTTAFKGETGFTPSEYKKER